MDSTGPDIKIRGSASHIYEKYLQLSRDSQTAGDRIKAENYLQHAEHYFRLMRAAQPAAAPIAQPEVDDGLELEGPAPEALRSSEASSPETQDDDGDGEPAGQSADERAGRPQRRRRVRRPAGQKAAGDGPQPNGHDEAKDNGGSAGEGDADAPREGVSIN